MRSLAPLLLLSLCAAGLHAQSAAGTAEPPPIQDNSFLIEEAYNQEPGVVQHINTFQRLRGGPWVATFTQEDATREVKPATPCATARHPSW